MTLALKTYEGWNAIKQNKTKQTKKRTINKALLFDNAYPLAEFIKVTFQIFFFFNF